MIKYNFNRLGSLVMQSAIDLLSTPQYIVLTRKLISEFQTNGEQTLYFQSGKSKVNANFPNVGFEITSRKDEWAATSFTKDITFEYDLYVGIKALAGPKNDDIGEISQVEHYIIALSEFVLEALNEPLAGLQFLITKDLDGNPINPPIKIYDSLAEGIQYGYLYNGALRIGKINWHAKIMRTGPINNPGQTGY